MEHVVNWVTDTGYSHIPKEATDNAKKCILDGLGVAIAGSLEPASQRVIQYVSEIGARPEASVIGGGFKSSCPHAALANGTMTHALDFDDMSGSLVHFTAVLMPTVLALGECLKISGKKALESYILGWEVGAKIGDQISNDAMQRGWHNTGTIGSLSAAIAAAKVLGLNNEQTLTALGIASSQAGGLIANFGTDTKPLHAGSAAQTGVVAGLLAGRGFTANKTILEGPIGFSKIFSGIECDIAPVSVQLGNPYNIISPGPTIKVYPSCGTSHPTIASVLEITTKHTFEADEISEVECRVSQSAADILRYSSPETVNEAKFSLHYCVARSLISGNVTLQDFTKEKIHSLEVQALMKRVRVVVSNVETTGTRAHAVTITLRDGRQYSHSAPTLKGKPENPLSWDEVHQKFRDCAEAFLDAHDIDLVTELVLSLESLEDINKLTNIITMKNNLGQ